MEIKYINFGIGNRVNDVIYIHKNLKDYPQLHDAIIEHEKRHTRIGWSFSDFMLDISDKEMWGMKKQYYKFIFKNPNTLLNYLPFLKIEGRWYVDINLIMVYFFMTLFFLVIFLVIQ